VIGVDFARDALTRLRARRPDLRLCTANVEKLPMRSASFHAYYSGGVVEHLEHGPEQALSEARRVLRENGVLLCSVPFYNPLRRILAVLGRRSWQPVSAPAVTTGRSGRVFWQYAFTRAEFEWLLHRHGFEVVESMGYSILWGLHEIPGVALLTGAAQRLWRSRHAGGSSSLGSKTPPSPPPVRPPLLRRLVVSEDVTVPVLGSIVRLLRATASNMIMFVCVKRGKLPGA
jgi:SAM-dependent methyltransferase